MPFPRQSRASRATMQTGTAVFANPRAPLDVLEGIERFLQAAAVRDVSELLGVTRVS